MSKEKMNELPADERPYEKCLRLGAKNLSDAELLAVILRSGCSKKQSVELAREIIEKGTDLCGLCRLDISELMDIKGVGMVKAVSILCVCELAKRISTGKYSARMVFDRPSVIADYYMEECRHRQREEMRVIMLNAKSVFLGDCVVSVGTINTSPASPREIFLEALKLKAVCIVLLHNHPSGDATPSRADIETTRRICAAGEMIGIKVADHIIIGDRTYCSMREKGLML